VTACNRSAPPQPARSEPVVQAPAAPSTADDVSYRATGTEPFWGLSVTQRELRVTWPELEPTVATAYTVDERADGRTYKSAAFDAMVTFKSCSDGMSDRVYPHTVTLEIGKRVLHGCGWPAGYDLGPAP
jgi:heat shock protein HslJ